MTAGLVYSSKSGIKKKCLDELAVLTYGADGKKNNVVNDIRIFRTADGAERSGGLFRFFIKILEKLLSGVS